MKFSKKENISQEQNFWISYADLMAGLLFVFILLIGSIIVKYVLSQSDLETTRANFSKERKALTLSKEELKKKKILLAKLRAELKKAKEDGLHLTLKIANLNEFLSKSKDDLKKIKESLVVSQKSEKDKNDKIEILLSEINEVKKLQESTTKKLELTSGEVEQLKSLINNFEQKNSLLESSLKVAQKDIKKRDVELHLTQDELALLEKKLLVQTTEYKKISKDLTLTKSRIKNLTGMKIQVISSLKKALGGSIDVDPKSGAIKFYSNILFNQGEYKIKKASKKELKKVLYQYIDTIFSNPQIKKNIESIVIEGHTNSDGNYMYNLELSQKRALEVMKFIFSLDFKDSDELKKYIMASGKSYSEPILKDGKEDKDASRRIEIKFRIKNDKAIDELSKFIK